VLLRRGEREAAICELISVLNLNGQVVEEGVELGTKAAGLPCLEGMQRHVVAAHAGAAWKRVWGWGWGWGWGGVGAGMVGPDVGGVSPQSIDIVVLLPAPLGPMKPKHCERVTRELSSISYCVKREACSVRQLHCSAARHHLRHRHFERHALHSLDFQT
jgi:hypothetical protein